MVDFWNFNNNNKIDWNHTWQVDWLDLLFITWIHFHLISTMLEKMKKLHLVLCIIFPPNVWIQKNRIWMFHKSSPHAIDNRNSFGTVIHMMNRMRVNIVNTKHIVCVCVCTGYNCQHEQLYEVEFIWTNWCFVPNVDLFCSIRKKRNIFFFSITTLNPNRNNKKIWRELNDWKKKDSKVKNKKRRNKRKTLVCTICENESCSNKSGSITLKQSGIEQIKRWYIHLIFNIINNSTEFLI